MRAKLAWSLLIAAACLFGATNLAAKASNVDGGNYTTKDAEFYLTPEQLLFIRPGLVAEIMNVSASTGMQPEVTFSITDPAGLPLDNTGITTPGVVDFRFTLAHIPMGQEQKVRLAYERDSRNGTLTALGNGVYKYTFDYVMDSDPDTTHTLVLGFRRDLREFDLDRYAANDIYNWVPSGMYDPMPRDIVTLETCNRCHDPLALHGSRWMLPNACTQCHNETGNTRFDVLIHAVHAAGEAGGHDFSEVTYPAPLNSCETCHTGGTPTENFPLVANPAAATVCDGTGLGETTLNWSYPGSVELQVRKAGDTNGKVFARGGMTGSATTGKWVSNGLIFDLYDRATMELVQSVPVSTTVLGCVGNAPGAQMGMPGAQHTNWMDHPSRAVCGSCHSNIDFAAGEGHIVQTTDGSCQFCHQPDSGEEFDISVAGAHQLLVNSSQFPGALIEIVDITDTDPGDTPTVTFSSRTRSGPLNPNGMNRLRFTITGPNEDFSFYAQETVGSSAVANGSMWKYTFSTPLPMDAEGSYTVSVEGRANATVNGDTERDVIQANLMEFAVTDAVAMPRRMVVDDEKCESCHVSLSLHGGGRNNANYCNTCHAPEATDFEELREGAQEQAIHMKYMIHKIHRGEEAEYPYVVAGHNQSVHEYGEVVYPGDLRNCGACHIDDSQQLPLPTGLLPTTTPQEWWDPMGPTAAACLSCHDGDDTKAHAFVNTAFFADFFGESCGTCHGEGKEASVDKVHAR